MGPEHGKVVIGFPNDISWFAMDPENAVNIAKAIIDAAVACGANVALSLPRPQVSEIKRAMIILNCGHALRSLLEQGKDPKYAASEIVDIVLREVA